MKEKKLYKNGLVICKDILSKYKHLETHIGRWVNAIALLMQVPSAWKNLMAAQ